MKPTSEHFRKLAGEAGFDYAPDGNIYIGYSNCYPNINKEIEALCQRVWNEAMDAAARLCEDGYKCGPENGCCPTYWDEAQEACAEGIRELKVKP